MGTSEFAATVLETLARSAHRPRLVVTRPDSRRGRGRRLAPPPVAQAASRLRLVLIQPNSVNDEESRARIASERPEVVCVCAYGGLIREPLLAEYPMLNVHPSLLPRWRGAAPIERAIMAGDDATGVSIMRLTAGLDSGPVCAQTEEAIATSDDYGSLSARLAHVGGELLVRTLDAMPPCHEQDGGLATYAEKISPADRRLDPRHTAVELERQVRALSPHIGAWLEVGEGQRLGVGGARVEPAAPGEACGELVVSEGLPALNCAEGRLVLEVVKPAGRREMSGRDWLRGRRP